MKERQFPEERTSLSSRPSSANVPGKKHAKLTPPPKKFQNPRQWLELEEDYDDDYDADFLLGEEEGEDDEEE